MDLTFKSFFTSKHVQFYEAIFPFSESSTFPIFLQITDINDVNALCDIDLLISIAPTHSQPNLDPSAHNRQYTRIKRTLAYLQDYSCNSLQIKTIVRYPLHYVLSYNNLSPSHFHFTLAISSHNEPNTYAQAVKDLHWREAMDNEIKALEQNNTWILADLPPGKFSISCKWCIK